MIICTRKIDDGKGREAGTSFIFAGFLATRPALDVGAANGLGWASSELVIDRDAGTITRGGVVVATLVDGPKGTSA